MTTVALCMHPHQQSQYALEHRCCALPGVRRRYELQRSQTQMINLFGIRILEHQHARSQREDTTLLQQ